MAMAAFGAAAVTAQFVSGKATRDALFLTSLDYTTLPAMLIATSVCSILLVALNIRVARRLNPSTLVPATFVASAALFLAEWCLRPVAPALTAVVVYLHISCAGPLLASGFWLVSAERFDPHTDKQRWGRLAGIGTLGGLMGAIVAERLGATLGTPALLLFLALLQVGCAWFVRVLVAYLPVTRPVLDAPGRANPVVLKTRSGLGVVTEAPHLRRLAYVVLLGTTSAGLLDYLFKAQATEMFGRGDHLLRFFAIYYAATSVLTFLVQMSPASAALERRGLAFTTSMPSVAMLFGGVGSLLVPGFASLTLARAAEAVFRESFFRSGHEIAYAPIPADEQRAAKPVIDVAFARLGDAISGCLIRLALLLAPAMQVPALQLVALVGSVAALTVASRLKTGYLRTLENSLLETGVDSPALATTRIPTAPAIQQRRAPRTRTEHVESSGPARLSLPADARDILRLRSRDGDQVLPVLERPDGLTPALVPHVIPLLAWDAMAEHAICAMRPLAESHVSVLVEALVDPNQDFAVRRRLVRVFSVCASQQAADGVMRGLDDVRFDVRFHAARSLTEIVERNPAVAIDAARVFAVVEREVGVTRFVWEGRRLLDRPSNTDALSPLDEFVRDRAGTSLAHVFTLLALVLPREPLQAAFQSLQTDDERLQATALEYLDGILPPAIRERLWPFLERRPRRRQIRSRDAVAAELLSSHHSISSNLEAMQRRILSPQSTVHGR
jgi:ATP:ADP antiporter, AAA family